MHTAVESSRHHQLLNSRPHGSAVSNANLFAPSFVSRALSSVLSKVQTIDRFSCPPQDVEYPAVELGGADALACPPQVNLFLRVVRRRDDGYHDLASLFHVIDLGDQMRFTLLPDGVETDELRCDMEGVPTDDSNLVIKVMPNPDSFLSDAHASESVTERSTPQLASAL